MQPRERERVHTSIPVEFTSDSLSGRGRVINLAVSGCEIESETPPPADAHVTLHLHIPRQQDPLVIALAVVSTSGYSISNAVFV